MIHGVYLKTKPNGKWHLVTVSVSPETAISQSNIALKNAVNMGNEQAQSAIQSYDSPVHIPELLSHIKEQKLLFN